MRPNVSRNDDANTDAALTSATPIISADAVRAVRRGEREAFSRASRPGAPNSFWMGAPSNRLTGLATVVERLATPRKIANAPPPARTIKPIVPPGLRNSPTRNSTAPTMVMTTPAMRRRLAPSAAKPISGRIAATGGIFAARRAGTSTDSSVTPTPTMTDTMIVRSWSWSAVSGKPAPAALNRAMMPLATPSPADEDAEHGGGDRDDERLGHDQASNLLRARSDRAHQRQLTQALADRDAEHVVDDERAHERGDEGEREQAVAEDRDELS